MRLLRQYKTLPPYIVPSLTATDNAQLTVAATSWVIPMTNMASGAAVNDYIVCLVATDGAPTLTVGGGAGWTKLKQDSRSGSECALAIFVCTVTVAGTVANLTLSSTGSKEFCAQMFRLTPPAGRVINALTNATKTDGNGTNPNPPAVTNPTTSAQGTMFIACWGGDANVSSTAAPAGYSNHSSQNDADASLGCSIGSATKTNASWVAADTEDPATFTRATEQYVGQTFAFYAS